MGLDLQDVRNRFPSGPQYLFKAWDFESDSDIADFTVSQSGYTAPSAVTDEKFGVFDLGSGSANASDNSYVQIQAEQESIRIVAGKQMWFGARIKASTTTEIDTFFGVFITDTDILGGVSDGFGFRKDDDDTQIDAMMAYNATVFPDHYSQETNIGTITTSYIEYMMWVVPDSSGNGGEIYFYLDGTQVSKIDSLALPNDEDLAIAAGFRNGTTAACNYYIDYMYQLVER